jgi:FkbM family methyltransferase
MHRGPFYKAMYRNIRYLGLVEYFWTWAKHDTCLKLPNGIEIDVKPDDILIDCGANVGSITSRFARTGAVVYAFEPHPKCWAMLKRRFSAMSNVFIFNAGVMDRQCKLILRTPNAYQKWDALETTVAASFIPGAMHENDYSVTEIEVECIDLDLFIRNLNKRVRILKLDIEGSEIVVLNRLLDTGTIEVIDLVVVETHERQIPDLLIATNALRGRINAAGLPTKIRLDWP